VEEGKIRSWTAAAISGLQWYTVDTRLAWQRETIATAVRAGIEGLVDAVAAEAAVRIAAAPA
jgi:hypothetical protein